MATRAVTEANTATTLPETLSPLSSTATTSLSKTESVPSDNPRTSLWLSCYLGFLNITNVMVVIPTASQYAETLGADDTFSGLAISLAPFLTVLGIFLNKWMLRFTSMKTVIFCMAIGSVLGNILYALAGLTRSKLFVLIGRSIIGLCGAQGIPPLFVSLAVKIEERSQAMFNIQGSIAFGYVAAPLIAWGLDYFLQEIRYENIILDSNTIPGWFMASLYVLFLLKVIMLFENPPPAHPIPESLKDASSLPLGAFLACLWLVFAATFCNSLIEVHIAKVAEELWHWNVQSISLYLAAISAVLIPTCLFAGRLSSLMEDRKGLMMTAPVGIVFSFLLLDFKLGVAGDATVLSLGASLLLIVATVARPLVMSMITKIVPPHLKGYSSTLCMASLCLGRGFGSMLGDILQPWSVTLTHTALCASMAILTAANFSRLQVQDTAS